MSVVNDLIDSTPSIFERFVIIAVMHDRVFFDTHKANLCTYDAKLFGYRNDFKTYAYNMVYRICAEYWELTENQEDTTCVPLYNWIVVKLGERFANAEITQDELVQITEAIVQMYKENDASIIGLAKEGACYWLGKKITARIMNEASMEISSITPTELIDRLQRESESLFSSVDDGVTGLDAILSLYDLPETETVHPLYSGIPDLDLSVGGGFHKKQSTVIGAATGGGKTVLATQLATNLIMEGRSVLYITTEQTPAELYCRNIAQVCNLDFKYFAGDRPPKEKLKTEPYRSRYAAFEVRAKEYLTFLDWSKSMDISALEKLSPIIDKMYKKGKAPDAVIFDWIGGGVDKSHIRDSFDLQRLMVRTAEFLVKMANRFNLHSFYTVQLDKEKSKNKTVLDSSMIENSKQMTNSATNVILVTNIRTQGKGEERDTFAQRQFLCVDKARKGPPARIPVIREFQFQRFVQEKEEKKLKLK